MSGLNGGTSLSFSDIDASWLAVPAGLLAAGAVFQVAPISTGATRMLAITLFCVALWVGSPVKPWFTALLCVGLIGVSFSTELALTGFQSPATWLVVAGILIGEAARKSGLADLVERTALYLLPAETAGDAVAVYRYLLVTLSLGSLLLAVLIPSSLVRVLILAPILTSLGDLFSERRVKVGIFLGPLFVTFYGASGILTGSLANIIITGLVESGGGLAIAWGEWARWLGPVMSLGRTVLVVGIAYVLYRPTSRHSVETPEVAEELSVSSREWRMLLFLVVGTVIWATDFVHGLHPLFGAVAVVLLAFMPRVGVAAPESVGDADFSIIFFLGAIFAIAEGLRQTGFTDAAATTLLSVLPSDPSLPLVLVAVVVSALVLTLLMEGLAVASVLTPVLVTFAGNAGLPLVPIAMMEAVALNTYFFPYQSAVLVAVLGSGMVDSVELTRMASICSLATLGVLVPIQVAVFTLLF
ncbi:SLC13 family permease [Haloarcula sebkhae]|uniref:SLC13 family permease n=2 Tax=Haloarcula sebkhae TaxID=932660 RepID=A0ACC6VIL3_9EURY